MALTSAELKERIAEILKDADLETTSAKKVRTLLEEALDTDLTSRKEEIGKLIEEVMDENADEAEDKEEDKEDEEDEEEEEEIPKKKFKREKQNMSDIFAHTNADIRSWIECPVCMITPRRGYIYQCYNGHVTCSTCYQRLKQDHNRCPECNEPYQRDKDNRCLMAEKIRDGLPFKCSLGSEDEHCDTELPLNQLETHEKKECKFRFIKCAYINCSEFHPLPEISSHMEEHRTKVGRGLITATLFHFDYAVPISTDNLIPRNIHGVTDDSKILIQNFVTFFYVYERYFFFNVVRLTNLWYFWMHFVGEKNDAAKFMFTILISIDEETVEWKKPVVPIEITYDEIFNSNSRIAIEVPESLIRSFIVNDRLRLKVQITSQNDGNAMMQSPNRNTSIAQKRPR